MGKSAAAAVQIAGKSVFDILCDKIAHDTHARALDLKERYTEFGIVYWGAVGDLIDALNELLFKSYVIEHIAAAIELVNHCHAMVKTDKRMYGSAFVKRLCKALGSKAINLQFERIDRWEGYAVYLIHADERSKKEGKKLYPVEAVYSLGGIENYKDYIVNVQYQRGANGKKFCFNDLCLLAKNSEALSLLDLEDLIAQLGASSVGLLHELRSLNFGQQNYLKELMQGKFERWKYNQSMRVNFTERSINLGDVPALNGLFERCGLQKTQGQALLSIEN